MRNSLPGGITAVVFAITILCAACSGQDSQDEPWTEPAVIAGNVAVSLPPLPDARRASDLTEALLNGSESYAQSSNASVSGASMQLAPQALLPAWAIYHFSTGSALDSLKVLLDAQAGAYVAVADYDARHWDILGPFSGNALISLEKPGYLENGNMYCAVLSSASDATVFSLSLRAATVGGLSADLNVLPGSARESEDVYLDASLSSDSDGTIAGYEWDTDGDGTFESSSAGPQFHFQPPEAGSFVVAVRVTDNDENTAIDRALLHVHGFLPAQLISAEGQVVGMSSMCIVGNRPMLAYYDTDQGDLIFRRALDSEGSSWADPITLDATAQAGEFLSMARIGGRPAVAYYHANNHELRFIIAEDSTGETWLPRVTVDTNGNVGRPCSLAALGNGGALPMIAYSNDDSDELFFRRGINTTGTSWTDPEILDGEAYASRYISLGTVSGRPAVAYIGASTTLRYIRALDINGSSWPLPTTLDDASPFVCQPGLAQIGGYPMISYAGSDAHLKVIAALDGVGTDWGFGRTLDSFSGLSGWTALCEWSGQPLLAYHTSNPEGLRAVRGLQSDGGSWEQPYEVLADHIGYSPTVLLLGSGLPALSCVSSADGGLMYYRYF